MARWFKAMDGEGKKIERTICPDARSASDHFMATFTTEQFKRWQESHCQVVEIPLKK